MMGINDYLIVKNIDPSPLKNSRPPYYSSSFTSHESRIKPGRAPHSLSKSRTPAKPFEQHCTVKFNEPSYRPAALLLSVVLLGRLAFLLFYNRAVVASLRSASFVWSYEDVHSDSSCAKSGIGLNRSYCGIYCDLPRTYRFF